VRAPLHSVSLDELSDLSGVSHPGQHAPAGSAIALFSDDFVKQETYWQHGIGRRVRLPSEILAPAIAAVDFCLVLIAAAATFAFYFDLTNRSAAEPARYVWTALFAATLFVGGFERLGGYRLKQLLRLNWQLRRVLIIWSMTLSVLLLVAFLGKTSEIYSRGWVLAWVIVTPALLLSGRGILRLAMARWVRDGRLARNIVIVGAGNEGQRLIAKLRESQDTSIAVRGVFDDRKSRLPRSMLGLNVVGTTDDLLRFARSVPVDEVIIALPLHAEDRLKALFWKLKGIATDLRLSIEPVAETFQIRGMSYVGTVPVLEIADRPLKHWRAAAKWIEDKVLSALLMIFLGPLMAIVALLIKRDSPGPAFFVQERFGFNNDVIRVLKFRTMYADRGDQSGAQRTLQNDPRITRVGRIVRALSIDELPQLMNVLRGDMSLVGPRPHAIAMRAGDRLYGDAVEEYLHRHRVKPGITGWAQVNGLRGEVDTLERARARVAHDLYYIEHWSPWLDLKILLKTVGILASRDNAY
jgi:Undecaprenyl-phosphate glucose phosphotransferase